jgi:hypothetical protein
MQRWVDFGAGHQTVKLMAGESKSNREGRPLFVRLIIFNSIRKVKNGTARRPPGNERPAGRSGIYQFEPVDRSSKRSRNV